MTEAGIESGNETPTKLDALPLAPQTPRYSSLPDEDQSPFFLHYDQDGTLMVDDDEPLGYTRTRSYSYQHAQRPAGEFTAGRKAMSQHHGLSVPGSRHFNGGMPGINLPPLPRSPSHISHTNDTLPSSPPSSIPPSPTATQSSNRGIAPSGSLWQRRQTNESEPITPPFQHIRARSQSTPNIQRPSQQHIPELPNTVQEEEYEEPRYEEDQMVPPVVSKIIKLKVHYYGAIYVVVVPVQIEFEELLRRIESKIKIAQESHKTVLGLKYEDEDGDLITISSNEDVQMGFESKGNANHVSLYVT